MELDPDTCPDVLLGLYYGVVTGEGGGEFGVSLLVGGSWLTGVAISGRSWFEQLGKVVDDRIGAEHGQVFRMLGQQTYPGDAEIEAGVVEAREDSRLAFIHLRDAKLVGPMGFMPNDGGLTRCRLDQVAAWSLGTLGPAGYEPPPPPV